MLNPILSFSATRRMRSFKTMLIVLSWIAVLLVIAVVSMSGLLGNNVTISRLSSPITAYSLLMAAQFVLIILIAPAMTSGAIAGERERQTLELLLVTNTRSFRIVTGKAMESFAMLALLIVCGFPVMCLTMITGAVSLMQILTGELYLLAVAFGAVCVGILASSLSRSTVVSGVMSYLMILAIEVVTALPMLSDFSQETTDLIYDTNRFTALSFGEVIGMVSPLLIFNPGYGLTALLQGQMKIFSPYMQYRERGRLMCEFNLMEQAGGQTLALLSSAAIVVLGFLLLLLAAAAVRRMSRKAAKSGGK